MLTRLRAPGTSRPNSTTQPPCLSNHSSPRSRSDSLTRSTLPNRSTTLRPPNRAIAYSSSAPAKLPIVAASTARTNAISPWPT
jgi:hypothetical protein